ncbi:glycoside hydrolase family 16 protein [Mycena maculata]|uniref:Glycoside hydrolase family 16 protein n=1 Tax=Mycena maculata TaxID=230809 RepID=A0AAD7MHU2_9AGAR|nr:glycoside hydrolase family 16 protein [Mycena maculata]
MPCLFAALLLISVSLPILTEAGPGSRSFRSRRTASTNSTIVFKNWNRTDWYRGNDFLEKWDFFDAPDPTHGLVNYQNVGNATQKKLALVQGDNVILAVDNTTTLQPGQKRDSVRISSKAKYNAGTLFIADFASMPAACGVWPAWWTVGPSWPTHGEVDLLEGVHKFGTNKMTLHTSAGCVIDRRDQMTGKVDGTNCESSNADNQGCGVLDNSTTSYGDGFNKAGGGVYAHMWTNDAIHIWHFARADIPVDITANTPDPTTWPVPVGSFGAGPDCDFSQHFQDHVLTIDTTICGDWAGNNKSMHAAGCPGTCEALLAEPSNFNLARWNISSISVYQ